MLEPDGLIMLRTGGAMTTPRYINEIMSDMRCIKTGWYAMDHEGKLLSGPFSSREECVTRINPRTNLTDAL